MRRLSKDHELDELSSDSGIFKVRPTAAVSVETEEELLSIISESEATGVPLTPRGAGTSIPSQSVGTGSILLQGRRRARLVGSDAVAVEPAMVKADLNDLLDSHGLWLPVDPSSFRSCTVGGMVSNNSSGIRTYKYGSTIDYVKGLRVATLGGGVADIGPVPLEVALRADPATRRVARLLLDNWKEIQSERPKTTKNSSGYRLERALDHDTLNLHKLFVGSEGTLCVLAEATFSTLARTASRALVIVESSLSELNSAVSELRMLGPTAVELVDKSVFRMTGRERRIAKYSKGEGDYLIFAEVEGENLGQQELVGVVAGSKVQGRDPIVVTGGSQVSEAWDVRNEILNVALEARLDGKVLVPGVEDLAVPRERLGELVKLIMEEFDRRGLKYISYGHAGDANLHARPFIDTRSPEGLKMLYSLMQDCFERVWKMEGTMTGEHGDGILRASFLPGQYPRTYHLMQEVKETYDPKGLLNPGVKIGKPPPLRPAWPP